MGKTDDEAILICAVRYAHGRRSYVVSEAAGWVRDRWSELSPGTRDVMKRDLDRLLEDGAACPEILGMEIDAKVWTDLRSWIGRQA